MPLPTEYVTLCRLRDAGSVTRTSCSNRFLVLVEPLICTGILQWEHAGAGRRLTVQNRPVLEDFLFQKYPDVGMETGSLRLDGIASVRDSKGIGGATAEFVIVWGTKNGGLTSGSDTPDVTGATARNGCFAFRLDRTSEWRLAGRVALVEYPDFFLQFGKLEGAPPIAILYSGRMSGRFIDWLAGPRNSEASFMQYADYDPIGLSEFCRLEARVGARAEFYIPCDIEALFARYSNSDIIRKKPLQQQVLNELRSVHHPAVDRIRSLIEKHNAALEQEAIFLKHFGISGTGG